MFACHIGKGVRTCDCFEVDASSVATIAAVRSALGYKSLAPEAHASVASVSALHEYFDFVNEHSAHPMGLLDLWQIDNKKSGHQSRSH